MIINKILILLILIQITVIQILIKNSPLSQVHKKKFANLGKKIIINHENFYNKNFYNKIIRNKIKILRVIVFNKIKLNQSIYQTYNKIIKNKFL